MSSKYVLYLCLSEFENIPPLPPAPTSMLTVNVLIILSYDTIDAKKLNSARREAAEFLLT